MDSQHSPLEKFMEDLGKLETQLAKMQENASYLDGVSKTEHLMALAMLRVFSEEQVSLVIDEYAKLKPNVTEIWAKMVQHNKQPISTNEPQKENQQQAEIETGNPTTNSGA